MRIFLTSSKDEAWDIASARIIDTAFEGMKLGVATGSTPLGLYARLRQAHAEGRFSLAGSSAWALDEYVGLAEDHPEGYRNVLRAELVGPDKTGLAEEDLHTPDGSATDLEAAATAYEEAIGSVDMQILGIGGDGHIGFNMPSGSLASTTHVGTLTQETREANARFFSGDVSSVPEKCLTQGLATIMRAKEIILLAFGREKARAVAELIEGPVSAFWPATVLQHHPRVTILADELAASELTMIDYYRAKNDW